MTDKACIAARTDNAQPAEPFTASPKTKLITFSRHFNDFDMYIDGLYVGSRPTHKAAEEALDTLAYEGARRGE